MNIIILEKSTKQKSKGSASWAEPKVVERSRNQCRVPKVVERSRNHHPVSRSECRRWLSVVETTTTRNNTGFGSAQPTVLKTRHLLLGTRYSLLRTMYCIKIYHKMIPNLLQKLENISTKKFVFHINMLYLSGANLYQNNKKPDLAADRKNKVKLKK